MLPKVITIRVSAEELKLLKSCKMHTSKFIREAVREKIERDLPKLIDKEIKNKLKEYCPF